MSNMTSAIIADMDAGNVSKLPLLVHAARSFRLRCLIDAQADIEKAGVITRDEYQAALHVLLEEELHKAIIMREIERSGGEIALEALVSMIEPFGLQTVEIIAAAFQLAIEGFLSCNVESPEVYMFTFVTSDPALVQPVYVPVKAVHEGQACSGCGTCQAACPVGCIVVDDGKVTIDMDKCIRCGLCYTACPRSFLPKKAMEWATKNAAFTADELKAGNYIEAWSARTLNENIARCAQDGGIASSLLLQAFQTNEISAAIGAGIKEGMPWKPEPRVLRSAEDVANVAGTKYVNTPSLGLLQGLKDVPAIAVVGTPCMMQALKKIDIYPAGTIKTSNIKYRIGIFCMESFTHAAVKQLCEETFGTSLENVTKMNIKEGQFIAFTADGEQKSESMKEVTHLARAGCHCCHDLSSELADISVGSIGSPDGWNSVLVRNATGKTLFDAAVDAGLIEKKYLDEVEPGISLVKKLAMIKKRNYDKEQTKRDEAQEFHPSYFMKLPPKEKKKGDSAEPDA